MIRPVLMVELFAVAAALPCVAACSRPSAGYDRYVPSATQAEEALTQVMAAWEEGRQPGPLELTSAPVTIRVADSKRKPGQRLVDYQLLGEISGEGPRTFIVRLKLDHPSEELEARYYVVGIDPLWVFRQEDYDAVAHWDVCEDPAAAAGQSANIAATK